MTQKTGVGAVAAPTFHRARKPEQIAARRDAILAAAAALFDEEGPLGAGINAIAARAGFTKSNVYRYFESREQVLISLFLDEFEMAVTDLERDLADRAVGDMAAVAHASAAVFLAHPRLSRLIGILASVLEENVSQEVIIATKRATMGRFSRIAEALHRVLPAVPVADCTWLTSIIGALVAGLWPSAHPGPAAAEVFAMPEFAALKPIVERDLERAILVMLRGVTRPDDRSRPK